FELDDDGLAVRYVLFQPGDLLLHLADELCGGIALAGRARLDEKLRRGVGDQDRLHGLLMPGPDGEDLALLIGDDFQILAEFDPRYVKPKPADDAAVEGWRPGHVGVRLNQLTARSQRVQIQHRAVQTGADDQPGFGLIRRRRAPAHPVSDQPGQPGHQYNQPQPPPYCSEKLLLHVSPSPLAAMQPNSYKTVTVCLASHPMPAGGAGPPPG